MDTEKGHLYLLRFKAGVLAPRSEIWSIYMSDAEGYGPDYEDGPVTDNDGRILLFDSPETAGRAQAFAAPKFEPLWSPLIDRELSLDLEWVLDAILRAPSDHGCRILNSTHWLREYAWVTRYPVPESYEEILRDLCIHLTCNEDIEKFFAESEFAREDACNALLWHVGAIFSSSKFLSSEEIEAPNR